MYRQRRQLSLDQLDAVDRTNDSYWLIQLYHNHRVITTKKKGRQSFTIRLDEFTFPMPHLVSISAATLPTPPTPTIITEN